MIRFAFALALLISGCGGASAIVQHAQAARIVGPIIHAAGDAIVAGRARERGICEGLRGTTAELEIAEREACLDRVITAWAPALAAYHLARAGYIAWTDGMDLMVLGQASDTEASDYLLPLALALVGLYAEIETALEPFEEIDIPDFPGLGLLGGE